MAADRSPGDFGSKLREARERRGISLRQIANATKISVVALEALERNQVSRLPGGIFSRAFVRSYALEVGLEPEQTIQEFIAQFPHDSVTAGHPQASQVDHEAHESDRRTATTFLRLIVASVPIAVAVLYFSMRRSSPAPPESEIAAPVAASEPAAAPGAPVAAAEPAPPPGAPMAASEPAPPPGEPVVASELTPPGAPMAAPKPAPPPGAPMATSVAAGAAASRAAAVDAAGGNPVSDVLTVGLLAIRECWVSVTADGERVERLMQAGERTTVEVRRELVLTARDAAAITLTLNGADARPLGGDGQVVTTTLNPTNFKEYLSGR